MNLLCNNHYETARPRISYFLVMSHQIWIDCGTLKDRFSLDDEVFDSLYLILKNLGFSYDPDGNGDDVDDDPQEHNRVPHIRHADKVQHSRHADMEEDFS